MANSNNESEPTEAGLPAVPPDSDLMDFPPTGPALMPPPVYTDPSNLGMQYIEPERPPYIAGTIDVAAFVKAQSKFVRAQSYFLREGRLNAGEEYIHNLTVYSKAQDDYIQSLHDILGQLGVT